MWKRSGVLEWNFATYASHYITVPSACARVSDLQTHLDTHGLEFRSPTHDFSFGGVKGRGRGHGQSRVQRRRQHGNLRAHVVVCTLQLSRAKSQSSDVLHLLGLGLGVVARGSLMVELLHELNLSHAMVVIAGTKDPNNDFCSYAGANKPWI